MITKKVLANERNLLFINNRLLASDQSKGCEESAGGGGKIEVMNRPELYKKTVDILYAAYFNDTLEHSNCFACAVGNMVAANMGKKFVVDETLSQQKLYWEGYNSYSLDSRGGQDVKWFSIVRGGHLFADRKNNEEIKSTGYSIHELRAIEKAFEQCETGLTGEEYMFNGLVAVLEALKQIHEISATDDINNDRFREHYNRKLAVANQVIG